MAVGAWTLAMIVDDLERINAPAGHDVFAGPRWAGPDVYPRGSPDGSPMGPDHGVDTLRDLQRAFGTGVAPVDGGTRIGDPS
jgi:hypothetical protein